MERSTIISTNDRLQHNAQAQSLTEKYSGDGARDLIQRTCNELFANRIAAVSSFGTEAAILLHLIADVAPATPVIFLDTDKHFPETLRYVNELARTLGLGVISHTYPSKPQIHAEDSGGDLHTHDTDRCCYIRKTLPMFRALRPYLAFFTGRKRFQTTDRAGMDPFEAYDRWIRINPLWNWSPEQISTYISKHDLPPHPLVIQQYKSVGCAPCTQPVSDDDDARAGRWAGTDKAECGIHITPDGKVIRQRDSN